MESLTTKSSTVMVDLVIGVDRDEAAVAIPEDGLTEFSFLSVDAARLGIDEPLEVERVELDVGAEGTISALRWKPSSDPGLLLVHGAGLHAHSWDSVALSLDRPTLAIDLPGHGHSRWREDADYSAPALALSLAMVGFAQPTITTAVGHSLGGLALIAALGSGMPRIRQLVLVDVTPGFRKRERNTSNVNEFISGPDSYASRDEVIDRALRLGIGSRREDLVRGVFLNTRLRDDGRVEFRHHLAHLPMSAHRNHNPENLWQPLADFDGRVLLLRGTHGILDEEHVAEFRERVPEAEVVDIDSGHNMHRDAPVQLAAAITHFSPAGRP